MPERDVMIVLSLVVGVACGLAAVLLKSAIEFIHHGPTSWFDGEVYNFLYLIYPGIGMLIAMLAYRMKEKVEPFNVILSRRKTTSAPVSTRRLSIESLFA